MSVAVLEVDGSTLIDMAKTQGAGARIKQRRERLGLSGRQLEKESGINRQTIADAEAGKTSVRPTTLRVIEAALDRLEEEVSGPYDSEHGVVTFRLKGNFGVDVTLQGPVDNLDELEASVTRLMTTMGRDESDSAQSGNAGT